MLLLKQVPNKGENNAQSMLKHALLIMHQSVMIDFGCSHLLSSACLLPLYTNNSSNDQTIQIIP